MNKWDERFMDLAETVAGWSSCYQEARHVGAVIVKDKRIIAKHIKAEEIEFHLIKK